MAELGRFPKREELSARGLGGLSTAMGKHGGVAEWRTRFVVTPVEDSVVVEVVETVEVAPVAEVSREAIAERAYYIALEQQGGDPFEHWVTAERELTAA